MRAVTRFNPLLVWVLVPSLFLDPVLPAGKSATAKRTATETRKARKTPAKILPPKPATSSARSLSRNRAASAPAFSPRPVLSVEEALEIARQTPLENVAALVPFFEQLYRHQNGSGDHRLHILHYGDSHTAADEWTGFLRALFQNRFGDGGAGWTHAGKPWSSFRRLDVSSDATPGWRAEGLLGRPSDGWNGLAGVSITTQKPGESVLLEASCDWLEVFYLRQPGGGSLNFYDNGVLVDRIDTQGERGAGFYRYAPVPGPHHFRLETVDAAPVRLFGWAAEQGHGVTYEMLGINGAQASIVFQWEEPLLAEHIARRNPALLVFAYGTNEASNFDWNRENYRHMFASLIQRFRRMAPTASILVIGPPDRSVRWRGGWRTFDAVDRIVEAQREAALGTGCAFWDLRAKMGGKGSMPRWVSAGLAQRDYVHFTAAGYRLIGGAIFEDLMNHYATFVKVRSQWMGQDFDKRNGQKSDNP